MGVCTPADVACFVDLAAAVVGSMAGVAGVVVAVVGIVISTAATAVAVLLAVWAIRATRADEARYRRQRLVDSMLALAPRMMAPRHSDADAEAEWKALWPLFETEENGREMFDYAWSVTEFGRWLLYGDGPELGGIDLPHPKHLGRRQLDPIIEVGKNWAADPSSISSRWAERVAAFRPFAEDRKRGEYVMGTVLWIDAYSRTWDAWERSNGRPGFD